MFDSSVLTDEKIRKKLLSHTDILHEVKDLELVPNTDWATVRMVADYYRVPISIIRNLCRYHHHEIGDSEIMLKKYKAFKTMPGTILETHSQGAIVVSYPDGTSIKVPRRGITVFTEKAVLCIGLLLINSSVAKKVQKKLLGLIPER